MRDESDPRRDDQTPVWIAAAIVFPLVSIVVYWVLNVTHEGDGSIAPRSVFVLLGAGPPLASVAFARARGFSWLLAGVLAVVSFGCLIAGFYATFIGVLVVSCWVFDSCPKP